MNYSNEINNYIISSDKIIKNFITLLSPLYKKDLNEHQYATVSLFTSLHSTSESILILLLHGALFDADVLLRTVIEGTIKYCYLLNGNNDEKEKKYIEYKNILTDIDKLSEHRKALETLSIFTNFKITNSKLPFETNILTDDEVASLEKKYSSSMRNKIKKQWSFQQLLKKLAESNEEYKKLFGLISTYSLTSHLIHYDWTGSSMRQAQITSSHFKENIVFDIAQAARILSNVLSFYLFRTAEYTKNYNLFSTEINSLYSKALDIITELDKLNYDILEKYAK